MPSYFVSFTSSAERDLSAPSMDRGEPPGGLEMRRLRQELRLGAKVREEVRGYSDSGEGGGYVHTPTAHFDDVTLTADYCTSACPSLPPLSLCCRRHSSRL